MRIHAWYTVISNSLFNEMLKNGRFNRVSRLVEEVATCSGSAKVCLVQFGSGTATAEVVACLASHGLRPARLEHLLGLAAQRLAGEQQYITALGTQYEIRGKIYSPRIRSRRGRRELDLRWTGAIWCAETYFLAEPIG